MEELVLAIKELSKHDWFDYLQFGIGILSSIIAIGVAIYIPTKIANKEQKIALFSYRLDCIKNLGKIFSEIESIKSDCEHITNFKMSIAFSTFDEMSHKVRKIHSIFNIEHQYIFSDYICNQIKFIYNACTQIFVYMLELQSAMAELQMAVSHNEELWYTAVKEDDNTNKALSKIIECCDKILSLEKPITQETYQMMKLKKL